MQDAKKPHIHLTAAMLAEHKIDSAIVCGDPGRAAKIASFFKDGKPLAQNREYHSYFGKVKDKNIMAISHGVGSSGAAICFQELIDVGVKKLIRVGTAGGLQKDSKVAGLVIADAAARKDGVSRLMVPDGFPAISDIEFSQQLYSCAMQALKNKTVPSVERGIILTSDLFYPGIMDDELKIYSKAGIKAVEMEISTLFTIATLRNVRAGAIVTLDGNPLYWDQGVYEPGSPAVKQSIEAAIRCALDVLANDTH